MKNILIGVFASVSVLLLGYIIYDEFVKEEKIIYKECNKEELCDECTCNECTDDDLEEDSEPVIDSDIIYSKDGKELYSLVVYDAGKITTQNMKINKKTVKIENKDNLLYVNNKKLDYTDMGELNADMTRLYVTNNYILGVNTGCQVGMCMPFTIDENGNMKEVDFGNSFNGYEIYLTNEGSLVSIGTEYCGLDCSGDKLILRIKYDNGNVKITTEKLR